MELMQASHQWATRPSDERFTSLHDMRDMMRSIRQDSREKVISTHRVHVKPVEADEMKGLTVAGFNGGTEFAPTNWAFGQLCQRAGAPASYLRKLPAALAADALNYGIRHLNGADDIGVLLRRTLRNEPRASDDYDYTLTAATGPRYGRVWNETIIDALIRKVGDGVTGQWKVPGEFGRHVDVTKDNTTLFASDRDMFVFLCDEEHKIEVPNRRNGKSGTMSRGFFLWNSEVGSQSIGAAFFLFDYVCCNRIVWGAEQFKEIRLRHTVSAPDRWIGEITPVLNEYANSATRGVVEAIAKAKDARLEDAKAWLANRYTVQLAARYEEVHMREEGRPIENLWDVATAMTAHARTIEHQDARVAIEREAGKVLEKAA